MIQHLPPLGGEVLVALQTYSEQFQSFLLILPAIVSCLVVAIIPQCKRQMHSNLRFLFTVFSQNLVTFYS